MRLFDIYYIPFLLLMIFYQILLLLCTSGYFQIAMRSKDIEEMAFIRKNVCYTFKRMAFGLSGAPMTFQWTMEIILLPVLGSFAHAYLKDVINTSSTFEEHLSHLEQIFKLL